VTAVMAPRQVRDDIRDFAGTWWLFLVTGVAWVFIAFFILQFDLDSIALIGWLFATVLILSGVDELVAMAAMPGWRWLHGVLGVVLVAGGIWAFAYPGQTFGTLALLVGWMLLFKGTFDLVAGLANRGVDLWWLTVICGVLEIALAFWAIGYPGRSAALLVLWVGFGALIRGITEIALAFQVRGLRSEVVA
jgi:uncharacterized membrane protein HdeD (DUF308 family)